MNTKRLMPLFAAFSFLLGGCGNSPTEPDPDPPEPTSPPSVELSVGYNLDNSSRSEDLSVAEGESVILEWSTDNSPASCTASGAWSGSKNSSGGEEVSDPLTGLGSVSFTLECENSAGSDRASVSVEVKSSETFHARSDRQDESDSNIHVLYAVPKDGDDRELDLNGRLDQAVTDFQTWMRDKAQGHEMWMDTYRGELDITFLRLSMTESEIESSSRSTLSIVREDLHEIGFEGSSHSGKAYLVYYDGGTPEGEAHGRGGGGNAIVNIDVFINASASGEDVAWNGEPDFEIAPIPTISLHEVFHALGAVDEDAPNSTPGNRAHVIDKSGDLMCQMPPRDRWDEVDVTCLAEDTYKNGFIDYNNDDYFDPSGNLPDDVVNVAESPFVK